MAEEAGLDPDRPTRGCFEPGLVDRLVCASEAFETSTGGAPLPQDSRADRLPLLQYALTHLWATAVRVWQEARGDFVLRASYLGLSVKADSREDARALLQALKSGASETLEVAVAAYGGNKTEARRAIAIALGLLAEQDAKMNWTRRFAALPKMLAAAGLDEPEPLRNALDVFWERNLLNRIGHGTTGMYEVAHEALIRNWPTLLDWLQEQTAARTHLRACGARIQRQDEENTGWLEPGWLWRYFPRLLPVSDQIGRTADSCVNAEASRCLQPVFDQTTPIPLRAAWGVAALNGDENASAQLARIRTVRNVAARWRGQAQYRKRLQRAAIAAVVAGGLFIPYAVYSLDRMNRQVATITAQELLLKDQTKLLEAQSVAALILADSNIPASLAAPQLYAAIAHAREVKLPDQPPKGSSDELRDTYRQVDEARKVTWEVIDTAARNVLGVPQAFYPGDHFGMPDVTPATPRATCEYLDPTQKDNQPEPKPLFVFRSGANVGLKWINGQYKLVAGSRQHPLFTTFGKGKPELACLSASGTMLLEATPSGAVATTLAYSCATDRCQEINVSINSSNQIGRSSSGDEIGWQGEIESYRTGASPPVWVADVSSPKENIQSFVWMRGDSPKLQIMSYDGLYEPELRLPTDWPSAPEGGTHCQVRQVCEFNGFVDEALVNVRIVPLKTVSYVMVDFPDSEMGGGGKIRRIRRVSAIPLPHTEFGPRVTQALLHEGGLWLKDDAGNVWRLQVDSARMIEEARTMWSGWPDDNDLFVQCQGGRCEQWSKGQRW